MSNSKTNSRAVGLDLGLGVVRWLTGHENLHYGLWDGLEVRADNLGRAQAAYTDLLFTQLPKGPLRILDIGGGAGETAARLLALGHTVEIVIPSAQLAERCRVNAPDAIVHECRFEDFTGEGPFDACLFSESFQYIALEYGLKRCLDLLVPGGHVLLADCFRTGDQRTSDGKRATGGGHLIERFRAELASQPYRVLHEVDITERVAPSIDLEQSFYNVIGDGFATVQANFSARKPKTHWLLDRVARLVVNKKRRAGLHLRFMQTARTSEVFCANNRYLMIALAAP